MSFKFDNKIINYKDINDYFKSIEKIREKQKERREKEIEKFKDSYEIIKNHEKFLIELNNKKLQKYPGNFMSLYKYKSLEITEEEFEEKLKNKINNYEITYNDDSSIDELSNLLSNVIEYKNKKDEYNYNYLNRKINILMIGILIVWYLKK